MPAHAHNLVKQMHNDADVIRHDAHLIAESWTPVSRGKIQNAVFFGHACDRDFRMIEQCPKTVALGAQRFAPQRLGSCIDHGLPFDGRADDGGEDGECTVIPIACADIGRCPVVVHVCARSHLGHPRHLVHAPRSRCRSAAHDAWRKPRIFQRRDIAFDVHAQLCEFGILPVHRFANVSWVEHQSGEAQDAHPRDLLGECDRFLRRCHTDAMHAEVCFDQNIDLAFPKARREGERRQCVPVIGGDSDAQIARQSHQAFKSRCANGWVRDQEIIAHVGHHFGLAQRRTGQPDRAQSHLFGGDAG